MGSDKDNYKTVGSWPAIIAAIIVLIVLVGIAFTARTVINSRAKLFLMTLIFGIIWFAIIYWFCITGNHAYGWTLLLFPFIFYLSWYIGRWLATVTVPPEYVMEDPFF